MQQIKLNVGRSKAESTAGSGRETGCRRTAATYRNARINQDMDIPAHDRASNNNRAVACVPLLVHPLSTDNLPLTGLDYSYDRVLLGVSGRGSENPFHTH